jgi:beta-N-acetylhexosaminidase
MQPTLIIDLENDTISSSERDLLMHPGVAGVILFDRNLTVRANIIQLTQAIHDLRPDLIVMIDHEGGFIQRIRRNGFRALMSARAHGEVYSLNAGVGLQMARDYGAIMARDLLECGIDLSLAPALDLDNRDSKVIGQLDRAFHATPEGVIALTSAYIDGMREMGMPSVGKHFPGHGSCVGDSHRELPCNEKSYDELKQSDLKPFIHAIKNHRVDALMPAHVTYPTIDPINPAGYSTRWLQGILRQELQFDGLIISDCLGMKGADIGDLATRADKALEAGCNLLIAANQTRAVVNDLLNHLSSHATPSADSPYLDKFKAKMIRFSANHDFYSSQSATIIPIPPPSDNSIDPLNPTHEI